MKKTTYALALLLGLILQAAAFADDISLGYPTSGGNGCPQGTASASISPDGKALSILFDDYIVQAGGRDFRKVERKTCNVSVPVHVPQGYSISLIDVDFRGYNSLPRGAKSTLAVEYFFAGAQGPRFSQQFTGRLDSNYLVQNNLVATAAVWSPCGADVLLRMNSNMTVNTPTGAEAMSTVDSADISAGMVYHVAWRRCQ